MKRNPKKKRENTKETMIRKISIIPAEILLGREEPKKKKKHKKEEIDKKKVFYIPVSEGKKGMGGIS